MRRWLRAPALHFLLLGGLLFALPPLPGPGETDRPPVVITTASIDGLRTGFESRWSTPPTRAQLEALVGEAIDDEILEAEAKRLALDFGDPGIRHRLVAKMRAVSSDPTPGEEALYRSALDLGLDDDLVIRRHLRQKMRLHLAHDPRAVPPTQEELAAWLERHRDRYAQGPRVSFWHVFVDGADRPAQRAAAIAVEIRSRALPPEEAVALSDAFPLASNWPSSSRDAVARRFGAEFADHVMRVSPGSWSEPVASPYGLHLVWVEKRVGGRLPPLDAVRQQVARALQAEREAERVERGLDRLRKLYEVRVEWPPEVETAETVVAERLP